MLAKQNQQLEQSTSTGPSKADLMLFPVRRLFFFFVSPPLSSSSLLHSLSFKATGVTVDKFQFKRYHNRCPSADGRPLECVTPFCAE